MTDQTYAERGVSTSILDSGDEAEAMRIALQDENEAQAAEIERLRGLLSRAIEMTGDSYCWHDHHGYCQAHNLEPLGECWVAMAQEALNKKGPTDD